MLPANLQQKSLILPPKLHASPEIAGFPGQQVIIGRARPFAANGFQPRSSLQHRLSGR